MGQSIFILIEIVILEFIFQGDSGGPLYINDIVPGGEDEEVYSQKFIQIGIVSYGNGCAKANSPG